MIPTLIAHHALHIATQPPTRTPHGPQGPGLSNEPSCGCSGVLCGPVGAKGYLGYTVYTVNTGILYRYTVSTGIIVLIIPLRTGLAEWDMQHKAEQIYAGPACIEPTRDALIEQAPGKSGRLAWGPGRTLADAFTATHTRQWLREESRLLAVAALWRRA